MTATAIPTTTTQVRPDSSAKVVIPDAPPAELEHRPTGQAAEGVAALGLVPGKDAGSANGGGLLSSLFSKKSIGFALVGAIASVYIPPLAFLGGPLGGAIAGMLLSQLT